MEHGSGAGNQVSVKVNQGQGRDDGAFILGKAKVKVTINARITRPLNANSFESR